jgi:hypothetical protein
LALLQGGLLRMPTTETLAALAQRFIQLGLTGYDAVMPPWPGTYAAAG